MLKLLRPLVYVLFLTSLLSCHSKKEAEVLFKKVEMSSKDTTLMWLSKVENYKKNPKYLEVLYSYYQTKITNQQYEKAAEILDIASVYLADSYDFNPKFLTTIKTFDANYRKEVIAQKTTFVDAYLANYYFDQYDLKKACQYFKKITLLEPIDYNSCYNIGRANYDLSYIYYIMGKQNLSLQANQKSFEYFSKINNPKGLAFVYSNYANIYAAIGDKKQAVLNANKAIKAYQNIGNTYNVYIGLINKISIYDFLKDPRKKTLIDSTYQAFVASKDDSKILKIKLFDFKIENLVEDHKFIEAKKMLDDLKFLVEEINSDDLTQEYKITEALYALKTNPSKVDFEAIKKALPLLESNQQYEKVNMFYGVLQKNALQKNDFKEALQYEQKKKIIADSVGNIAERIKITELEMIYQTSKKEQQIALQETTILNKNTTIAFLASLFLVFFLIVIIYYIRQKQKKLKLEKESVQIYTKQLLEKTEEERKRIASDLHDSVSHELLSLKKMVEEKNEVTNTKIDAIINDIRIISRNLHPVMFDKIGLKASVEQLVDRVQSVNSFLVTADIEYHHFLSTNDELQVYRIIQEALSNIIKYADAIAAKISIVQNEDLLHIEIKDNGKGFNVAEMLNGKKAFGLHNIIERSRAIGGVAKILSDKNGTIITVQIKKVS